MRSLKIDPEFRDKIPPLTDDEYQQLRQNIISDGEIYEPIVAWNDTIVDGHNRWKVHLEFPDIPLRIKDMEFADKWAAFDWMYRKQLGRRNLTDEQRTYMIGKMKESRTRSVGLHHGNQYAKSELGQNEPIPNSTAGTIAAEIGVSPATVKRAEKFAKGVDAVRAYSSEAAETILSGKTGMSKSAVRNIATLPEEEQAAVAEAIRFGNGKQAEVIALPQKPENRNVGRSAAIREERELIGKIYEQMTSGPTEDDDEDDVLIHEIELSVNAFIASVRQTLTIRSTALNKNGAREKTDKVLDLAQQEIQKVRTLLCP